jgi:hypothetical protein
MKDNFGKLHKSKYSFGEDIDLAKTFLRFIKDNMNISDNQLECETGLGINDL